MSLLLNVPHTYRKDGVYYLQRYVPEDVRKHYKTNRISFRFEQSLHGRLVLFLAVPVQSLKPIGILLGSRTEKCPLSI